MKQNVFREWQCGFVLLACQAVFTWVNGADAADSISVAAVLTHPQALAGAHDVELAGPLAFVAGKGGSIAIIDVAKPTEPRLVWFQHDPQGLFDAETVLPVSNRLFLGTNDFLSLNVTDPAKPTLDAKLVDRPRISRINGMVLWEKHILTANKDGWIDAFDISDPAKPQLFGALSVRERHDIAYPHDIDRCGDYIVVADPQQFGRTGKDGKLALFRVADAETHKLLPVTEWTLAGVIASQQLVGANRVKVAGRFAFVGGSQPARHSHFVVVDVADPQQPREVAALEFSDLRGPNGLAVAGHIVFLAGGQTIEAIDVSEPAKPKKLASQRFTDAFPTAADNAHDLVYRDGYLYVTGQNDHRLVILSVHDDAIRRLANRR